MSQPASLQNQFVNGMRRDNPRNRMPRDSAWTLRDLILEYDAPARERAGWQNASPSVSASAASIKGGLYATYSPTGGAVGRNVAVDEDGQVYLFTASGVTALGAGNTLLQNPVFHGGAAASAATSVYTGLAIFPDALGTTGPYAYDGSTLFALHGSPPAGRYATVFKDYTVLANGKVGSTEFPNRVWYSPQGDPDCSGSSGRSTWDTTDSWVDFIVPVKGLAATKNLHIVFGDSQMARVRGSVAPPDSDFTVDDPWLKIGLLDARSITMYQDTVYWCAPQGVFRTDGVSIDDLTQKGGMLRYWLDLVTGGTTAYSFTTGIIRNKLLVFVLDGGVFVDGFAIDLQTYSWSQLTNIDAYTLWDGQDEGALNDETFFGRAGAPIVGSLDSMFASVGQSADLSDGNGNVVASVVETMFYEAGDPGLKVWKALYAGYALNDLTGADPTIEVAYVDTPESTSYVTIGTLGEQAAYDRRRIRIGGRHFGLGFKFTRSGAGDFLGYDLMADVTPLEGSKLT